MLLLVITVGTSNQLFIVNNYRSLSSQSAYILIYEKNKEKEQHENIRRKVVSSNNNGNRNKDGDVELIMDIEGIDHSSFKKDMERSYMKKFHDEILEKNQKLLYVESLFSEYYGQFLKNLIEDLEETAKADNVSVGEVDKTPFKRFSRIFKFIWLAFVTVALRSNDVDLQRRLFEWIFQIIDEVQILTYVPY